MEEEYTDLGAKWRKLLASVGRDIKLTLYEKVETELQPLFMRQLPPELRAQIYELLIEEDDDGAHSPLLIQSSNDDGLPTMFAVIGRPRSLSSLLLTCKSIYQDAVDVIFRARRWYVEYDALYTRINEAYKFGQTNRMSWLSALEIMAMPTHLTISLFEDKSDTDQLVQQTLRARHGGTRRSHIVYAAWVPEPDDQVHHFELLRELYGNFVCTVRARHFRPNQAYLHQLLPDKDKPVLESEDGSIVSEKKMKQILASLERPL